MIRKLLIANRGEIACRIQRTAHRLGIATVAVYSDADRDALHVRTATEAVAIGPPEPERSYLNIERLLDAAAETSADAIHPGYGFLSENAEFAARCRSAERIFVGPPASAIATMGSKSAAKQAMQDADVPVLPGYHGTEQDVATLSREADAIGYPVLLKAVAGGGGKGMRIVMTQAELPAAYESASREARASFGDPAMLVEKFLTAPRHVEVQVFFDRHGNGVYLFERDCSLQRRHQKVIEEAPAPGIAPALREALGAAAVKAAAAVDYEGAGTVEFLLDADGAFYFMEMNTRLQVEHPVTELVSGCDLVEWQLRVADGERLPKTQGELKLRGHAIEARLYAEDVDNDFLPQSGRLDALRLPAQSETVRVDTGVESGDEISVFYDPMIAKIIASGDTRSQAIAALRGALMDVRVRGVTTNERLLYALVASPAFGRAELDTGFINAHAPTLFATAPDVFERWLCLGAVARVLLEHHHSSARAGADRWSPWLSVDGFRVNQPPLRRETLSIGSRSEVVLMSIATLGDGRLRFDLEAGDARRVLLARLDDDWLDVEISGVRERLWLVERDGGLRLYGRDGAVDVDIETPSIEALSEPDRSDAAYAPMSGTVIAVHVGTGDAVTAGQTLLVVEAMKMEHALKASHDATVDEVRCAVGDAVNGDQLLVSYAESSQ
ncbi:MAG: biotin carboxylase N-terminal domain-containing protein [Pseudomonadota bacterium]